MFLKKLNRMRHTLAFRLTLFYAGVFAVFSLAAGLILYLVIGSAIRENGNEDLMEDIAEFSIILSSKGIEEVKTEIVHEAESDGVEEVFLRLLTPTGEELAASDMSSWESIRKDMDVIRELSSHSDPVLKMVEVPGHEYPVRTVSGAIGPGIILQMGESTEEDEEFMEMFRTIFGATFPVTIIFAAAIGWFMGRRAMRGVEQVTQAAMEISGGKLDKRVSVKSSGDEIQKLATMFNDMLDRIQSLIVGMREITDNIAHDLRSPLARIRGNAEMALTNVMSNDEYETVAANIVEECDQLLSMVNTMLDITEIESGVGNFSMQKIDFAQVVRDACDLFQPVAEKNDITMTCDIDSPFFIRGDRLRLQRMVANLLDNALKYTPPGGRVTVSVEEDEAHVVFSVCDSGIGISEDDRPHIFKRFYRCDESRSHAGSGLGLSLAQAIAGAHGGTITVTSAPGKGSAFSVSLPKVPLL